MLALQEKGLHEKTTLKISAVDRQAFRKWKMLSEDLQELANGRQFVELEGFRKDWKNLGLTDDDLKDLQNQILNNSATSVNLGGNTYKIRFSPKSSTKGKSGSDRVIFIDIVRDLKTYFIIAFSKSDEANISPKVLQDIKEFGATL